MKTLVLITAALLMFSGCGYKEGVVSGDAKAYLYFTGDPEGVQVSIDDARSFEIETGRDHRYRIPTGKHTVRILRDGAVVSERRIYVDDGVAKEIMLP